MHRAVVFIAVGAVVAGAGIAVTGIALGGCARAPQSRPVRHFSRHPHPPPDAAPGPPPPRVRGEACNESASCRDGLACLAMPGGYCGSTCDACGDGGSDGGVCVEIRSIQPAAPACMRRCTADNECRADEGYVCDAAFHACVLPNTTPIVPRADCPKSGPLRDPAFGPPTIVNPGRVAMGAPAIPFTIPGDYGATVKTADGRTHVVALEGSMRGAYGSAMHRIRYAYTTDGNTVSQPITVSPRDESIPFVLANPQIAVDDRRKLIYIVYARGDRGAVWDVVVAVSKDRGATWTRTIIGDGCSLHALPAIAIDPPTGVVHVAYYANGTFAHATCPSGGGKCSRKGAIADVAFTTNRFGPDWLGDRAELAITGRTLRATWIAPVDGVASTFTADARLSP